LVANSHLLRSDRGVREAARHFHHERDGRQENLAESPVMGPLERLIYKICGVKLDAQGQPEEQHWTRYAGGAAGVQRVQRRAALRDSALQVLLPFNPQGYSAGNVSPDLAFNTSVSFTTNTNWQSYVPETTLSYFVQMAGPDGA
jgi:K+-transporting ATPase ATPase A chain